MYKVLIWGCGWEYNKCINQIKYQELLQELEVIGVTGQDELYKCLDGYPFISINEIETDKVDYVIVTSNNYFSEICEKAEVIGFKKEQIIKGNAFHYPEFKFQDYIKLKKSEVSIIANNCWGGATYNALGLEFLSPFINMFLYDDDYIRLLGDLKNYLKNDLKLKKMSYVKEVDRNYPICNLGDIELHFNHYVSMDEVEEKWYKRVERINWDNLFVMMFTTEKKSMQMFDKVKYTNKICFVPFESECHSAYKIQVAERDNNKHQFWYYVNSIVRGYYSDYNVIDLLNTGKIYKNRYYLK